MSATTTRNTSRPACSKREKLPYPDHVDFLSNPLSVYWLASSQCKQAKEEALTSLIQTRFVMRRFSSDDATANALVAAKRCLRDETDQSLAHLRDAGGLLFLHPATTALQPGAVQACAQAFSAEAAR